MLFWVIIQFFQLTLGDEPGPQRHGAASHRVIPHEPTTAGAREGPGPGLQWMWLSGVPTAGRCLSMESCRAELTVDDCGLKCSHALVLSILKIGQEPLSKVSGKALSLLREVLVEDKIVGLSAPSAPLPTTPSCVVRSTRWREGMESRGTWTGWRGGPA